MTISTEAARWQRPQAPQPSGCPVPAATPAPPHRCGSCTSGWATSSAPTRPGTPTRPPTPPSGGSPPSPAGPPQLADALTAQDGLYTLITRGRGRRLLPGRRAACPGPTPVPTQAAWLGYLADPEVRIVTLTVTEAGYVRGGDGGLDTERADIRSDLAALRGDPARRRCDRARPGWSPGSRPAAPPTPVRSPWCRATTCPTTAPSRPGWSTTSPPLLDADLADWIDRQRLLRHHHGRPHHPGDHRRTTSHAVAELTGRADAAPVVTEPFTEWVLSGEFPGGRPAWDDAGARFVDDIVPVRGTQSSGCSTEATRCWPTPAAPAATRPSPRRSPIRCAGTG